MQRDQTAGVNIFRRFKNNLDSSMHYVFQRNIEILTGTNMAGCSGSAEIILPPKGLTLSFSPLLIIARLFALLFFAEKLPQPKHKRMKSMSDGV